MPKKNFIWILAVVAASLVTVWVTRTGSPQPGRNRRSELDGVEDTYRLIKNHYYGSVEPRRLRCGAVSGMVSELDQFSTYVCPEKLGVFSSRIAGMDRGLGLQLEELGGRIRVVGPVVNSPAHKAGIVAGDVVLAIDGKLLAGVGLAEVRKMLEGEVGTRATVTIQRDDGRQKVFKLTREEFPIETLEGLYRDSFGQWVYIIFPRKHLAYVRVKEFVHDTGRQLREVLRRLGGLRGLVLDLRGNPGGALAAAAETCNVFLRQGVIATSVSRDRPPKAYLAEADGTLPDVPIVVLINGQTASAAEIVAGALKLHDRAVLVGTRTRGKGLVQTMFRLPDGLGQVNLTTSQLLIGEDESITRTPGSDRWGVDPHDGQEVVLPVELRERLDRLRVRAAVLPAPRSTQATTRQAAAGGRGHPVLGEFMQLDRQLVRAVELLSRTERYARVLKRAADQRAAATRPTESPDE